MAASPRDKVADALYCPIPIEPFPGEALFSFFGRWLELSGNRMSYPFMAAITGGYARLLSMALPCRLDWMRENLDAFRGRTLEQMVERFTVAPFYRPFASQATWATVTRLLGSETGSRSARMRLGIARFGEERRMPVHCVECMKAQLDQHGCLYWPLRFMLPYVTVCPEHGLPLIEAPTYSNLPPSKNPWLALPTSMGLQKLTAPRYVEGGKRATQLELALSRLSVDLFDAALPSTRGENLSQTYAAQLRATGFDYVGGRVKRKEYAAAVQAHWHGLRFLETSPSRAYPAWVSLLHTTASAPVSSPLHHLLAIGFLFGDVASWKEAMAQNNEKPTPTRQELQRQMLLEQGTRGMKQVQVGKWVQAGRDLPPAAKKPMPEEAAVLFRQGLQISEVIKQTGLPRMTLYRRLWANHDLAKEWALAALKREMQQRFGINDAHLNYSDGITRSDSVEANKAWLYRHRTALEFLQAAGHVVPAHEAGRRVLTKRRSRAG